MQRTVRSRQERRLGLRVSPCAERSIVSTLRVKQRRGAQRSEHASPSASVAADDADPDAAVVVTGAVGGWLVTPKAPSLPCVCPMRTHASKKNVLPGLCRLFSGILALAPRAGVQGATNSCRTISWKLPYREWTVLSHCEHAHHARCAWVATHHRAHPTTAPRRMRPPCRSLAADPARAASSADRDHGRRQSSGTQRRARRP